MHVRRLITVAAALFSTLAAIAFAACSSDEPGRRLNVLFISIDTLRWDRLGCYGHDRPTSPTIDSLAAEGVTFEQAIAPKGSTWPSLTSVMTGKYPITHGVRRNGDMLDAAHRTIAEHLKGYGYRTAGFLANMTGAPNRGFDSLHLHENLLEPQYLWDADVASNACKWLRKRKPGEPFFAWVHLMDPHEPYQPPKPYDQLFNPGYLGPIAGGNEELIRIVLEKRDLSPEDREQLLALYDGQIASADAMVHEVLKALKDSGTADDTLIVFFADHGEELLDHQHYLFHSCSLFDGTIRVPLIFHMPSKLPRGKRIEAQVELVDVAATLFELLDAPRPAGLEGESLAPLIEGRGERENRFAYLEYAEKPPGRVLAIRDGRWKLIYNPDNFSPRNPPYSWKKPTGFIYAPRELYDLASDPREQSNVIADHPEVARELEEQLLSWHAEKSRNEGRAQPADAKTVEAMKRLGYIGDDEDH